SSGWRWFHAGALPARAVQPVPGGKIWIDGRAEKAALYARVSSEDERPDLDRQLAELRRFCARKRIEVAREATEVCSGVAAERPALLALIEDRSLSMIVVVDRDRLAPRLGLLIESALKAA